MEADFGAVEPAGDAVDRQNGEADARLVDAEVAEAHREGSHHDAVEDAAQPVVGAGVGLIEQEDGKEMVFEKSNIALIRLAFDF